MMRAILLVLITVSAVGCTTTVIPPAKLNDPVTIYLTDENIHSSVLLPVGGNQYMEYARGDWNYAALNNHWPWDVIAALFFSRQGALGRRVVEVNPDQSESAPAFPGARLTPMRVERSAVQTLLVNLELRYLQGRNLRENPNTHLVFVKDQENYSLFNNCNSLTKRSLAKLGCAVNSRSPFALYHLNPPASSLPALAGRGQPVLLSQKP